MDCWKQYFLAVHPEDTEENEKSKSSLVWMGLEWVESQNGGSG